MKSFNLFLFLIFLESGLKEEIKFLKENPEKSDSIISLWVEHKEEVLPELLDFFKNPKTDIFVKQKMAIAFGKMGDKRALPYLYEGLKSSSSILRENCVRAIGEIGDTSGFTRILPFLKDKNDAVRGAVIHSISRIDLGRAKPYLINSLKDPSFLNRANAIIYLGKTHDKDVIPYLLSLKNDPNPFVRTAIVKALGEIKDTSSLKFLEEFIKDRDPAVRKEALLSINKISIEEAISLLEYLINDPEISVRRAVLEILKNVPPDLSFPAIYKLLFDPSKKIREKAESILEKMENKERGFVEILKGDYPFEEKRWAFRNLINYLGEEKTVNLLSEIYSEEKISYMIRGEYRKGMSMEEIYISLGKPSRIRKGEDIEEWDYDSLGVILKFQDKILKRIEKLE